MIHRDPAKYSPTDHFMQACRYRDAPKPSPAIAADAIRHGELTHAPSLKPDAKDNQVVFVYEQPPATWHVVAEANERAYTDDDATHPLITIYALDAHGPKYHGSALATD